ncbi:MAG: DegT/DnrJ/EryC1/StrS aminotransferase family protein [Candidatus Methanoperedens sp.]|nr:DegT/DnrJ/EryC1/StrS aminotransferase family protein [Candidatus Methanoperedens sp.]MCZ7371750.1 DegT/DnrJ/EryC1/StrS aminotransferase family protein [Candidatus Methanoperedens sp.]
MEKFIPIAKPIISEEELKAIGEVLKSGMLAQGKAVGDFEKSFSEYIDVKSAIAVGNGTIALDMALKSLGIKEGDEVITTPFTFIATANSILFQKAKPVFADVDERTFNIDPGAILNKITGRTKAIIGVHLFGHPFNVKAISEICEDHKLLLIEDCAQAHGAEYKGKKVGGFGTGCFSFYPTKNITTGEGGMITTNDDKNAELCRLLRNHGQSSKYYHTILGYNYRMTDIQAAIGNVQLKKLDEFNKKRIDNAEYFNKYIKLDGITKPHKEKHVKHVYHQYVLKIDSSLISREKFMEYLNDKNIGCAVHYPLPIHKQPLYLELGYTSERVNCPVAEKLADEVLSLPVHPAITEENLAHIVDNINKFGEST